MSSRSRVTITLGRSGGQVVKRDTAADAAQGSHSSDYDRAYAAPSKRSVRDRLGDKNNYDSRTKRQRRETDKWAMSSADMDNNRHNMSNGLGREDLRLKIMRNRSSRRLSTRDKDKKDRDIHERFLAAKQGNLRQRGRQDYIPMSSKQSTNSRRIPLTQNADDLQQMEPVRKSYHSWNGMRHRSPLLDSSRADSPLRRFVSVPFRSAEPLPHTTYMMKNVIDPSRSAPSYMAKAGFDVHAQKSVMHLPSPGSGLSKRSCHFDELPTVGTLLNALGLGKYALLFQAEEVDMTALKQMSDNDLKALGIPMGPRKKILLAVAPRPKQRPV